MTSYFLKCKNCGHSMEYEALDEEAQLSCFECGKDIQVKNAVEDKDGYPELPINLICKECATKIDGVERE